MKTQTVFKKLGHLRSHGGNSASETFFTSRVQSRRFVVVIDKGNGYCTALPIEVDANGNENVVFHAKTVKSIVEFMQSAEDKSPPARMRVQSTDGSGRGEDW